MKSLIKAIKELIKIIHLVLKLVVETAYSWVKPVARKDISRDKVLITGAARGLGRELALEFFKQGATLILIDINVEELEETKRILLSAGLDSAKGVFLYQCDVSRYNQVEATIERIRSDVGNISILINNAGIVNPEGLVETSPERYAKSLSVNLAAHAWTTKCCLPSMINGGKGHVVTISSLLGLTGWS